MLPMTNGSVQKTECKMSSLFATLIVCVLCSPLISIQAQQAKTKWRRVYTAEESMIEINVSSLRLEPDRILRAEFRTILSKPENLEGSPQSKYKSRLETIDFKLNEKHYRLSETVLLDPNGKRLQSYTATPAEVWRVLKEGGVMERLFNAARALPPSVAGRPLPTDLQMEVPMEVRSRRS